LYSQSLNQEQYHLMLLDFPISRTLVKIGKMAQTQDGTKITYRLISKLWLNKFRDGIEIVTIQCKEEIANSFPINGLWE